MLICDHTPKPKGRLHLLIFENGRLIEEWSEDNLILNAYRQIHAKLLGGAGDADDQVLREIAFGTSTTPAASTDTAITGAYTKAFDLVQYPAVNQVQFQFSLAGGENNGMAIGEFGLLTDAGTLYARRVRTTPVVKSSSISLSGTWTVTFP